MRQITVNIYDFEELSDKAKEKAREWYRSCIDTSDFDATEEDITTRAKLLGYDIKVFWSGFGSQGDGARFVGKWSASDVKPGVTKEECPTDENLHQIADNLEQLAKDFPAAKASISDGHRRYNHEYSVSFECEHDPDAEPKGDEALAKFRENEDKFEHEIIRVSRQFMKWAYAELDEQNDYLHSDEYVDDAIIGNEYEFTEDGKVY